MFLDRDSLSEIGATLSRNKTRTFLTAFGIFWGTLMLSLLWGGGQGARRMMYANFEGFATNSALIFAQPTTKPYKGYKKGMKWNLTTKDVQDLRRMMPELEAVSPVMQLSAQIKYSKRGTSSKQQTQVICVDPSYTKILSPIVVQGRFISDEDISKGSKVCAIGQQLANSIFRGDDPMGKLLEVNGYSYRVVGVLKQQSDISIGGSIDESLIIPLSTGSRAYNLGDKVGMLMLLMRNGYTPSQLRDKIYSIIRRNHPLHPDDKGNMWFWDISDQFSQIDTVFSGLNILLLFVGFSSLLAGIIGVGNIMWIVVKERTKEFGIRRAIGAHPTSIMSQILAESAILTVIAGMAAIVVSTAILALVTNMVRHSSPFQPDQVNFMLSFSNAATVLLLFIVLGSAAGTLPAIKAMRIKPIEALNDK